MPKFYTEEFKQTALDLIAGGMTQKQVCADLGVSKSALQAWVKGSRLRERGIEPSNDPEESREQAKMLRRIHELEQENKVLREAAAYLSQANLKLGGSRPK
ncbi:transposase [Nesterenkonia aerolata]|uniref:Transposase n=1 Tax=Nesterenkonia aerolata TaxID=3074079 RepID=A0ABU2DQD0_9MICC|nr:transposase [Nesterenkonia sp. LY-0111]MDR8018714.1 transposase [Nesterenkonia sp. LY-0111]